MSWFTSIGFRPSAPLRWNAGTTRGADAAGAAGAAVAANSEDETLDDGVGTDHGDGKPIGGAAVTPGPAGGTVAADPASTTFATLTYGKKGRVARDRGCADSGAAVTAAGSLISHSMSPPV